MQGEVIREQMAKEIGEEVLEPSPQELYEELLENATPIEEGVLNLNPDRGMPGDKVKFDGNFTIPEVNSGKYGIRMQLIRPGDGEPPSPPIILATATLTVGESKEILKVPEIKEHYEKAFKEVKDGAWKFADAKYKPGIRSSIKEVVKKDMINKFKYEKTWFNCDDYAIALHGALHHYKETAAMANYQTWVMWKRNNKTYGHDVVSYDEGQPIIIEPQEDSFFTVPKNWILWLLVG